MAVNKTNFCSAFAAAALSVFFLFGCSSTPPRGEVKMIISNHEAHVAVNTLSVKPGDKVRIYRSLRGRHNHREEEMGVGVLREPLNSKYYVLELPNDSKVREGDYFSKTE